MLRPLAGLTLGLSLALALPVSNASAQTTIQSGSYLSSDGLYTIQLDVTPAGLVVVEPNQRSVYAPAGPNEFRFTSARGSEYGIRVVSSSEIETFRPGGRESGVRFRLRSEPVIRVDSDDRFFDLAESYLERAETDPANVLLWTSCSALAHGRGMFDDASFREFALQPIATLRAVMDSGARNPCPDVIPAGMW